MNPERSFGAPDCPKPQGAVTIRSLSRWRPHPIVRLPNSGSRLLPIPGSSRTGRWRLRFLWFTGTNPGGVLSSHRASELTGQSPLPLLTPASLPPFPSFARSSNNASFRILLMNYKETLNLPKTDFPMKANLITREPEILAKWQNAGLYRQIQERRKDAPLFVLHDGPPFANGDVHMGTPLNKILKDLIVKSRSMLGFRAPFVPGWDCHGLPIEFKVVNESRGLSPLDVRQRSEQYARKYMNVQRNQFRRLGG